MNQFKIASILEIRKRRREFALIFIVAFVVVLLTWFEIYLFDISQQLPFVHSIFFFGLVNFNVVLFLLMIFLIFRNIVKAFVERRGRVFGSSLKSKLILAFVAFSSIPTILLMVTAVFYINSSFDKWFSVKMAGILKGSLEVTDAYYFNAKKKNYHFANQIAADIRSYNLEVYLKPRIRQILKSSLDHYSLDAVEYYSDYFGSRELVMSNNEIIPIIPKVSLEFLQKGIRSQIEASTIHQFGDGNLVRVIVPVQEGVEKGAVVVSSFVPLSLVSKMTDIANAYDDFRDVNPLQYPLKSIYLINFILMTFVIILAATWFGFYLAKQLSIPLVLLGRATKRVASGDYARVEIRTGSEEIAFLVESFNQMTGNLAKSEFEVQQASRNLRKTLSDLDEHTRYIEVVLGSVSTGVISVNKAGKITTLNQHAGHLLKILPDNFIGRPVRDLLTLEYFRTFADLLKTMVENNVERVQKEITVNVAGEDLPLLITLSILKNERGEEVGKVFVFDDLSPIANAQRAAAWTEVARRIAHEIKNPLTPIKLSAERLQRKFGDLVKDPAFSECTKMIIRQTEDLKDLVNEFSQFARLPQARPIFGSLNKSVREAVNLFQAAHPEVEFDLDLDAQLPEFKFDPGQMYRVLVNLIDNSLSAMIDEIQKKIAISTGFDPSLRIARLIVSDNGHGVPPEERSRIFEPYFSTKSDGTGLGLAIVRRIVEDHNGFIRVFVNAPKGTKMLIELPVNELGVWKSSRHSDSNGV